MSLRILICDDEPAIARVLEPVLTTNGYQVLTAATALEALRKAREEAIDLVLLDLGLPDLDGKDIIPTLGALGDVAIIVVSARHQEVEKVAALDAGADDYVDKPFRIDELLARIRAVERRLPANAPRSRLTLSSGLSINFERREVQLEDVSIKLSPKEYDLLCALAEKPGRVVTHRRLLLAGWGDPAADPQYLRSYIALLRQKLEADPAEPRLLISEPGVGYRLTA